MRYLLMMLTVIIIMESCNSKAGAAADDIPAPLQNNKSEYEISSSKSRSADMVENLFEELKKEKTVLQEIDKSMASLKEDHRESLKEYQNFDDKNNTYYSATSKHLSSIRDSTLRNQVSRVIQNSFSIYNSRIQSHQQLVALLENKNLRIDDLYTVLKLTKTLQVMDSFQQSNLPSLKALQEMNRHFEKIIATIIKETVN